MTNECVHVTDVDEVEQVRLHNDPFPHLELGKLYIPACIYKRTYLNECANSCMSQCVQMHTPRTLRPKRKLLCFRGAMTHTHAQYVARVWQVWGRRGRAQAGAVDPGRRRRQVPDLQERRVVRAIQRLPVHPSGARMQT